MIALPVMQKYGFTGRMFPVANYIGKTNRWDVTFGSINRATHLIAEQITILSESGLEIGSHGVTHTTFM